MLIIAGRVQRHSTKLIRNLFSSTFREFFLSKPTPFSFLQPLQQDFQNMFSRFLMTPALHFVPGALRPCQSLAFYSRQPVPKELLPPRLCSHPHYLPGPRTNNF